MAEALDLTNFGDTGPNCQACQSYEGASWDWCGKKWQQKAEQQANKILWHWGLVHNDSSAQTAKYRCSFLQSWKRYDLKGYTITFKELRDNVSCDSIEGMFAVASQKSADYVTASGKNGKINQMKWAKVASFLEAGTVYQNNNYETCAEIEVDEEVAAVLAQGEEYLLDRPEPMSNGALAAIIAAGGLGMMFIIYRATK